MVWNYNHLKYGLALSIFKNTSVLFMSSFGCSVNMQGTWLNSLHFLLLIICVHQTFVKDFMKNKNDLLLSTSFLHTFNHWNEFCFKNDPASVCENDPLNFTFDIWKSMSVKIGILFHGFCIEISCPLCNTKIHSVTQRF